MDGRETPDKEQDDGDLDRPEGRWVQDLGGEAALEMREQWSQALTW